MRDSRLRALLRGGPVFDEITPECEGIHRANARHPFQRYCRRFGVRSCVCSQTFLPGGLKPTGRKRLSRSPSPGPGSGRSEAEVDGVVMQPPTTPRPLRLRSQQLAQPPPRAAAEELYHAATNPPSDFAASSVGDSFSVPCATPYVNDYSAGSSPELVPARQISSTPISELAVVIAAPRASPPIDDERAQRCKDPRRNRKIVWRWREALSFRSR